MEHVPSSHDSVEDAAQLPQDNTDTCNTPSQDVFDHPVDFQQFLGSIRPQLAATTRRLEHSKRLKRNPQAGRGGLAYVGETPDREFASHMDSAAAKIGNAMPCVEQTLGAVYEQSALNHNSQDHRLSGDDSIVAQEATPGGQDPCLGPSLSSKDLDEFMDQDESPLVDDERLYKELVDLEPDGELNATEALLGELAVKFESNHHDLDDIGENMEPSVVQISRVSPDALPFPKLSTSTPLVAYTSVQPLLFSENPDFYSGVPSIVFDNAIWLRSSSPDADARQPGSRWTWETIVGWVESIHPET